MKILFIGSVVDNKYSRIKAIVKKQIKDNKDLWLAAGQLGEIASKRNHTIVVGSEKNTTVDHYVVKEGLLKTAKKNPKIKYHLDIFRPDDKKTPFSGIQNKNIIADYFGSQILKKANEKWLMAHHSAITYADVVIAIGGGQGTERSVLMADALNIPILPIGFFGGGAELGYNRINMKLKASGINTSSLNSKWRKQSAVEIIKIAEKIGRHSYFISHSHKELKWCDLVHLSLLQHSRVVYRDKDLLIAGNKVQPLLIDAIQKSETFIMFWSKESSKSKWCIKELKAALKSNSKNGIPKRIVFLLKDSTPMHKSVTKYFQLQATNRTEIFEAINKLVKEETK